jgi:ribonuclease BN (tRNA processing enzyme)
MKVELWGVRGTCPVSGEDRVKYGGHTLCASIRLSESEIVIIDAGTGIRRLGEKLRKEREEKYLSLHLFLTHFHLDHIMGIPFFGPLYSQKTSFTIYAPSGAEETENYLSAIMAGRFYPVDFKDTPSQKIYKKAPLKDFSLGKIQISSCPLRHPQGSTAYRLESKEQSIVFATDTEHPEMGVDKRLVEFARNAKALIYDAMFTPGEYEAGRQGWGHSTWLAGTRIAREAAVKTLYLSHFNPAHSDSQIDEILSLAQKEFPSTKAAGEGVVVDI